jgi:broad specificity phosphatase PhoE
MVLRAAGDFPVYFARHGETIYNAQTRVQGWQDSPLTERGQKQAHEIALILRDFVSMADTPRFVCSPLGRARLTMEIVLGVLGLPTDCYTSDERLLEVDYGEWSGRHIPDIETNDRERWEARERDKWNVPAPGGESYAMVAVRAATWFSDLRHETVATGHGAFGRILRGLYQGLSWQEMATMDEPQGVVFRLQQGTIARIEPPLAVSRFDDHGPGP